MAEPHTPAAHSLTDDAQAFVLGAAMTALGLQFLTATGLITGQTAGLAVLLSYLTPLSFGAVFFAVNLPFYILAWTQLGARFTLKTAIAVAMVSGLAELFPLLIVFDRVDPVTAAILGGACIGLGLIVLFRHGASLGGVGVVAYWAQDRFGVQAGWVQLGFDAVLFAAAFLLLDPVMVGLSLLGAVVVNLIIAVNHRRDRYIGR
ncbi:MAG: YitT family protein [Rhodobacteraceae bacterium]|jgi:uncharacterized membrane-anchored protein YitT (DUF2179 family)|nr:YitT family protein [Paracoccaceae bacterium]